MRQCVKVCFQEKGGTEWAEKKYSQELEYQTIKENGKVKFVVLSLKSFQAILDPLRSKLAGRSHSGLTRPSTSLCRSKPAPPFPGREIPKSGIIKMRV